jgi:hypothetical protein
MRIEGWESRLVEIIEFARHQPYVLGSHDCFRVACMVVASLTGVDRWPELCGYKTRRQSKVSIAKHGKTFEEAGDWFFGADRIDVRHARRGDICALQTPDGEKHLGVCLGAEVALLADDGLVYLPTLSCLCAWRVG